MDIASAILDYVANPAEWKIMIAIAIAESRRYNAAWHVNTDCTVDYGLWQINSIHNPDLNRIWDVDYNASKAGQILKSSGLHAWSTYGNGAYRQFLDEASKAIQDLENVPGPGDRPPSGEPPKGTPQGCSKTGEIFGTPYGGGDPNSTHSIQFNQEGGSDNWQSENAVDICLPFGAPLYAVIDGRISPPGTDYSGYGPQGGGRFAGERLHLVGDDGNVFFYGHLSRITWDAGSPVKEGQTIGQSGEANSVSHLHFAVKPKEFHGKEPNPTKWATATWRPSGAEPTPPPGAQQPDDSGEPVIDVHDISQAWDKLTNALAKKLPTDLDKAKSATASLKDVLS